jgi:hypothetical protein
MNRQQQESISRRALAERFGVHPDSLSRLMSAGLAIAIAEWGGRGKEQLFSFERAERFMRAWRCRQQRQQCWYWSRVLEDCQAVAEHLITQRHVYGECRDCTPPPRLCQPCGL